MPQETRRHAVSKSRRAVSTKTALNDGKFCDRVRRVEERQLEEDG